MRRGAALLVLSAMLAGCVHLSQPAPQIRDYRLAYDPAAPTGAPLPVILGIPSLRVAAVYDREPIVYRDGEHATGTYFYERWSANPGDMVADLLARDFADSGLYRAVQRGPSLLPIDYQLTGIINEIEERIAGGTCTAHLALRVLLVRVSGNGNPVRLKKDYAGHEPCACNQPRALAAAMSRVLERISAQLQQDVYDAIATTKRES
jgi:ABC-type uncharacterized transport system auxiliary subunit